MKLHADRKREDFTLAIGDKAYIRLYKGYHLAGIPKAKLGQQRVGPFEVLKCISSNAYRLNVPDHWKIWPVINAMYLDRASRDPDPFECDLPPQPVITDGELDGDHWEVAAIVNKWTTRRRVQYLVRWPGFGPEEDVWMDIEKLSGCKEIIKEYEVSVGNTGWESPSSWNHR